MKRFSTNLHLDTVQAARVADAIRAASLRCRGKGEAPCDICEGTPGERGCKVCHDTGREWCRKCRGQGRVYSVPGGAR